MPQAHFQKAHLAVGALDGGTGEPGQQIADTADEILQSGAVGLIGQCLQGSRIGGRGAHQILLPAGGLEHIQIPQQGKQLVEQGDDVPALQIAIGENFKSFDAVAGGDGTIDLHHGVGRRHAQCLGDPAQINVAVGRYRPVQQRDGVTHTAVAQTGQQRGCGAFQGEAFLGGDLVQASGDDLRRDAAEIVPLAAGKDGGRHLVDLGGGQNEQHVLRGLFQGLQQGVVGTGGQHVHLVDDVNTLGEGSRRKGGLFPDVTDVVHAVVGSGVDLADVQGSVLQNGAAGGAGVAGAAVDRMLAAHRPGQDLGTGGLAGTAGAGEQIGVAGAAGRHLIAQSAGDVVLAKDIVKGQGPPFTV